MDKFTEKTNEFLKQLDEKALVYHSPAPEEAEEDAESVATPVAPISPKEAGIIKWQKQQRYARRGPSGKPTPEEAAADKAEADLNKATARKIQALTAKLNSTPVT